MAGCKCRYCQEKLLTQNAYKIIDKKKNAYFCNEEHYNMFLADAMRKKEEENAQKLLAAKEREEKDAAERERIEKYKADKDRAYYLICEIIGRKEIINTALWKEWAIWNKVASNEVIGDYLEKNKLYLISTISNIEDDEFKRIRYFSAILKNSLGDYNYKPNQAAQPKIHVEETLYTPAPISIPAVTAHNNKRRSLADLEDEFNG